MVEGIVLAAGSSSRAGCFKMELRLGDKTLIERSIEGMYGVCSRIIVVGGYRIERIRQLLSSYHNIEIVENKNWQSGMFGSAKAGVRHVATERFFLLPADIPLVPQKVYDELARHQAGIVVPTFNGRKGHPILLSRTIIHDILAEPDNSSLRHVIQRKSCKLVPVQDEHILLDIDSMSDYEDAIKRFSVDAVSMATKEPQ
ncbi:MAG: nucleotidyltransferase family protein [Bacteroidetes bacterium]|nr:nucleotidyltransferase family protein [Bacteroidota bacterium]MCW5895332.1 nucleotidyltransferase family protein [Bacteroidota bacterium]